MVMAAMVRRAPDLPATACAGAVVAILFMVSPSMWKRRKDIRSLFFVRFLRIVLCIVIAC